LLDCQTTLGLTSNVTGNSASASTPSNSSDPASHNTLARSCVRVTALLLSARCLLRLDWIPEARVMLDKARQESAILLKSEQHDQPTPQQPKQAVNGVRYSMNSVQERGLEKFFSLLECEIRTRELEVERKQRAEAAAREQSSPKPTDPTESDAAKPSQTET
uniref:TPR_REGION domain-containing protein n=1 Tax=Echinostoma caproni TaxID=27848 RepID=A0A183A3Y0_9TREM